MIFSGTVRKRIGGCSCFAKFRLAADRNNFCGRELRKGLGEGEKEREDGKGREVRGDF